MRMLKAIPAIPTSNMERSVAFYRDKLGFMVGYQEPGFAIFHRDEVVIHLWTATDESWRTRSGTASPVISGAESFIAGTVSCRVEVKEVDQLHAALQPLGILHRNAQLKDQWYGAREFGVVDPDNNLIIFFERKSVPAH